jgi:hypothetical protein
VRRKWYSEEKEEDEMGREEGTLTEGGEGEVCLERGTRGMKV